MESGSKVLLIGVDGFSPLLIERFIEEGKLENMARIKENGASGLQRTTVPPLSAPAWSSIATGMNPGKHGVFAFITEDRRSGADQFVIHNSKSLKGKAIWDRLGETGKKTIAVNVPLTYPPYPINGIMVSGFPAPVNRLKAYPAHVESILKKKFPDYRIDDDIITQDYTTIGKDKFLKQIYQIIQQRHDLSLFLANNYEWDLFFVVFTMSDRIQHVFWPYIDEKYDKKLSDKEMYEGVIPDFYVRMDTLIGSLMENIKGDKTTFIVSDHDFETLKRVFGLGNWLIENGYMKGAAKGSANRYGLLKPMYKLVSKYGLMDSAKLYGMLPSFVRKKLINRDIAYPGMGGFNLNQVEGDETGTEIVKEIIHKLRLVKDGDEKVISSIFSKEELYKGEYLNNAKDYVVIPNSGYAIHPWTKNELIEDFKWPCGNHLSPKVMDGLFMAYGDRVKKTNINTKCYDLAPTIMHLLGVQEQGDMDGRVLSEIFE